MASKQIEQVLEALVVLVADGNSYTRRLTRAMLQHVGVRTIYESSDGVAALEAIRGADPEPNVMILAWDLPLLDSGEVMRIVRSPDVFPKPNLPVIMLMNNGVQSSVTEAMRLGVHEVLVTPISPHALEQRLLSIMLKPRVMVRSGDRYIPMPRRHVDLNSIVQVP